MSAMSRLVQFVAMRDDEHDQTYKNYDLMYLANRNRTRRAMYRLEYTGDELSIELASLSFALAVHGQPVQGNALEQVLQEWFVWDRIQNGELRTWKYRPGQRGRTVTAKLSKAGVVKIR